MNKTIFGAIVILILVFGLAFLFWPKSVQEKIVTSFLEQRATQEQKQSQEVLEELNPISLPYLFQKEFDGQGLELGRVLEENTSYTRYYITYESGSLTISGIMNIPKGQGPFPVLILNHGYIDPVVYTNGRGLRREQDYLARQGFAVLHPDYRNHAQSSKDPDNEYNIRLGYTEDVINVVLAVKNSGIQSLDTANIGMLGHSMGGGITQNVLAVKPDLVKAAVLYAPVSMDAAESFERWTRSRPEVAAEIEKRYGSPTSSPEFWKNISTENFVDRIKAPIKYFHGTADKDVPVEWSQASEKRLKEAGKEVELVIYDGQPHEFVSSWTDFMRQSTEFFSFYLK